MTGTSLRADEARRIALRAQGLLGAPDRRGGVPALLRRLGAVQLDTISVLARSHELVPYARLGPIGRERIEGAYWAHQPGAARAFEYWSHAACILPAEDWPAFAFRRRAFRARGQRWHEVSQAACDAVLARLEQEGPMTTGDLGGAGRGGEWWDWSEGKVAVEWLLDIGEVVVTERRGWRRVYDLPQRALAPEIVAEDLDDHQCLVRLVTHAGGALGVATAADLADQHRLRRDQVLAVLPDTPLVPVEVQGWGAPAWADPAALAAAPRGRHRTTLLTPFDPLVWDRARTERIFDFTHRLEAYVPKAKRIHGYFAMPLLAGGRLAGRVDPAREGTTLVARQVSVDPHAIDAMATALREAAGWVGCDDVVLERVLPAAAAAPLRSALSR